MNTFSLPPVLGAVVFLLFIGVIAAAVYKKKQQDKK
jgi:hypothetical protein